jgi:pseudouridine-5'-phosphate glycosidase
VVANPIPDAYAMDPVAIEKVITKAIEEMQQQGIHGKQSTPFLLSKIAQVTQGESLAANIQLVLNNARLGADIAVELAKLSSV